MDRYTGGDLIIIGTHHFDMDGEERLTQALHYLQPSVICREGPARAPRISLSQRNQMVKTFVAEMQQAGIDRSDTAPQTRFLRRLLMTEGYEVRVVERYAEHARARVYALEDEGEWSRTMTDMCGDEFFEEMGGLLGTYRTAARYQQTVDEDYARARRGMYLSAEEVAEAINAGLLGRRDEALAESLLSVARKETGSRLVFVGGMLHAVPRQDGQTLVQKLPSAKAYLLDEFSRPGVADLGSV